jgi:dTDP-4-amino-4,6-dideoxygalactose transaminase
VRHVFAEPLFIDIAPDSYNISVNELERFIEENCDSRDGAWFYKKTNSLSSGQSPLRYIDKPTGRIAAILAVHQMGFPCSIHQISLIADRLNVPLIEDAACSIGSEIIDPISGVWRKLGSPFGLAACFSFHPRKVLTTGEGGMIATNDAGIDGRVKLYRAHYAQKIPRPIPHEQHLEMGYNFRLTDLQAAVGIEQLKRLPAIVKERAELAANYYSLLSSVSEVRLRDVVATEKWNWQSFPIEISSRSEDGVIHLIEKLQSGGVSVKQGIMNAHEEPTYQAQKWRLPQSESRRRSTMLLPFFNGMTHVQQRVVVQKLKEALI